MAFLLPGEEIMDDGQYKQKIKSFHIPMLINYKLKNNFYVEAGPQVSWMRKCHIKYYFNSEEILLKTFNSEMLQRIDVGMMGGFGYKLRDGEGMTLRIRFYKGFVDIYKMRSGTKSHSINLKMNIPIGVKKAQSKG